MPKLSAPENAQFKPSFSESAPSSKELLEHICEGLLEKKAIDITVLDVSNLTTLAEFFVVCHGNSDTQVRAISANVDAVVKEKLGESAWKKEGLDSRNWVILDYVSIVVHILTEEKREFYGIERMWKDAIITHIEDHSE